MFGLSNVGRVLLCTTNWTLMSVYYCTQLTNKKKIVTQVKCSAFPAASSNCSLPIISVSSWQKAPLCLNAQPARSRWSKPKFIPRMRGQGFKNFRTENFLFPLPAMNIKLLASSLFFILSSLFFLSSSFLFFVVYENRVSKSWHMEHKHWSKQQLAVQREQTWDC